MTLRVRFVVAAVVVGAGVGVAALALRNIVPLGDVYLPKALLVFGTIVFVSAMLIPRYHAFAIVGPANVVTLVRAGLLAMMAALAGEPVSAAVAWTAVVTGATIAVLDGVDGWTARRTGLMSAFGARFDMETDALLIMTMSVLVWTHDKAGAWVLIGGALRYGFELAGVFLTWMRAPLKPTMRGKTLAVAHMVGLCVALGPIIPWPASAAAVGLTLCALVWSFALDVGRLWRGRGASSSGWQGGRR